MFLLCLILYVVFLTTMGILTLIYIIRDGFSLSIAFGLKISVNILALVLICCCPGNPAEDQPAIEMTFTVV